MVHGVIHKVWETVGLPWDKAHTKGMRSVVFHVKTLEQSQRILLLKSSPLVLLAIRELGASEHPLKRKNIIFSG